MKVSMQEIQKLNGQRKNYIIFNGQRTGARYPDAVYVTASVQKDPCQLMLRLKYAKTDAEKKADMQAMVA